MGKGGPRGSSGPRVAGRGRGRGTERHALAPQGLVTQPSRKGQTALDERREEQRMPELASNDDSVGVEGEPDTLVVPDVWDRRTHMRCAERWVRT